MENTGPTREGQVTWYVCLYPREFQGMKMPNTLSHVNRPSYVNLDPLGMPLSTLLLSTMSLTWRRRYNVASLKLQDGKTVAQTEWLMYSLDSFASLERSSFCCQDSESPHGLMYCTRYRVRNLEYESTAINNFKVPMGFQCPTIGTAVCKHVFLSVGAALWCLVKEATCSLSLGLFGGW